MAYRIVGKRKPTVEVLDKHVRVGRSTMRVTAMTHERLRLISSRTGNSTMLCALRAAADEGAVSVLAKLLLELQINVNTAGEIAVLLAECEDATEMSQEEAAAFCLLLGLQKFKGTGWRDYRFEQELMRAAR